MQPNLAATGRTRAVEPHETPQASSHTYLVFRYWFAIFPLRRALSQQSTFPAAVSPSWSPTLALTQLGPALVGIRGAPEEVDIVGAAKLATDVPIQAETRVILQLDLRALGHLKGLSTVAGIAWAQIHFLLPHQLGRIIPRQEVFKGIRGQAEKLSSRLDEHLGMMLCLASKHAWSCVAITALHIKLIVSEATEFNSP